MQFLNVHPTGPSLKDFFLLLKYNLQVLFASKVNKWQTFNALKSAPYYVILTTCKHFFPSISPEGCRDPVLLMGKIPQTKKPPNSHHLKRARYLILVKNLFETA